MNFSFMEILVLLIRQIKKDTAVKLFYEHRGFWPRVASQREADIYCSLGYELILSPGLIFESCFLQKTTSDFDHIEIIGDRKIPEHQAFATKTFKEFRTVVSYLKGMEGLITSSQPKRLDNGVWTAMFKSKNSDTAVEIVFRPRRCHIFDPKRVFG